MNHAKTNVWFLLLLFKSNYNSSLSRAICLEIGRFQFWKFKKFTWLRWNFFGILEKKFQAHDSHLLETLYFTHRVSLAFFFFNFMRIASVFITAIIMMFRFQLFFSAPTAIRTKKSQLTNPSNLEEFDHFQIWFINNQKLI